MRIKRWLKRATKDTGTHAWGAVIGAGAVAVAAAIAAALLLPDSGQPDEDARPDDGAQVEVVVETNQDKIDSNGQQLGAAYLIDAFPAELPPAPVGSEYSCSGRWAWAQAQDALVADRQTVRVTMTLPTDEAWRVTGVEVVRDPESQPSPPSGTLVTCSGSGGTLPLPHLQVALNGDSDSYEFFDERNRPDNFYFSVEPDQVAAFDVTAQATQCDCTWHLEVTAVVDGAPVTVVVDDHGTPFRVVDATQALPVAWNTEAQQWQPTDTFAMPPPPFPAPSDAASMCTDADEVIEAATAARVRAHQSQAPFSVTVAPVGTDQAFVSLCSWTLGRPLPSGQIRTIAVQHLRFADEPVARINFEELRRNMGEGWRRDDAFPTVWVDGSETSALVHDGADVFVLTSVPTSDVDVAAMMGSLLSR